MDTFLSRTDDVHDATETLGADRNRDGSASVEHLGATDETLGTVHRDRADRVLAEMLRDLENEATALEVLDFERIENRRQVLAVEPESVRGEQ